METPRMSVTAISLRTIDKPFYQAKYHFQGELTNLSCPWAFTKVQMFGNQSSSSTVAWKGSPLIFQFLDFLALGKSFRHMHIPLKVTASLKVKKALKWPWKVYLCDVNICSDPDFNSEKADFQAPLLWTYHRVPAMKKICRPSLVSLLSSEKILCFL